jgi:uncharacterized protein YbbC (DUF1343 family)
MKIKKIYPKIILHSLLILLSVSCTSTKVCYNLNAESPRIKTGLENFMDCCSSKYKNKKILIATNHSGVNSSLIQNITLLRKSGIIIETALAPEHGLYGNQNDFDNNTYIEDKNFNLKVYNLHKLDENLLKKLISETDTVFFDIQDMGMRCYTYISNLKRIIDAMDGSGKEFVVLDRPNPISFLKTDGAYLDQKFKSKLIAEFPAPFIYNMTPGESAMYYKSEFGKKLKINVIKLKGFSHGMKFHETGLPWILPSPNLPTYESAIVYTAMVLLEGINFSIGRGTTKPFEYIGAPWIDPVKLTAELKSIGLKNFKFMPVYFSPTFSKYKGELCGGSQIFYTGGVFSPTETAYKIISKLLKNYPQIKWESYKNYYTIDHLAGTDKFRIFINSGKDYMDYFNEISPELEKFKKIQKKYKLY